MPLVDLDPEDLYLLHTLCTEALSQCDRRAKLATFRNEPAVAIYEEELKEQYSLMCKKLTAHMPTSDDRS